MVQTLNAHPSDHPNLWQMDDNPRDGVVTFEELIVSLLTPRETYGGKAALSIGFTVHLTACSESTCTDP